METKQYLELINAIDIADDYQRYFKRNEFNIVNKLQNKSREKLDKKGKKV